MSLRITAQRRWIWVVLGVLLIGGVAAATSPVWLPWTRTTGTNTLLRDVSNDHDDHDHGHSGEADNSSIQLSGSALKNIGYRPITVKPTTFTKTITVPAIVVERPGWSQIEIAAPLTGVVTKIHPVEGAAIEPETALFEIRLTHEELVTAQSNMIRTAETLDVVNREISRLRELGEGVIAGKQLLEQQYEKQKHEASLRAEQQALLLHGLTQEQVEAILRDRQLFRTMTVRAPAHRHDSESCREDHLFHVQSLPVKLGQHVEVGQVLSVLGDHCELYIEGRAFEDDAVRLREAARQNWEIAATLLVGDRATEVIEGLTLLYLADHVDPQSRVFRFYLSLPNQVLLDRTRAEGHRFLDWRFKPGQRMELRVPVERWENQFVLPVEGVVDEGAETYVYQQNGNRFDRVPVHVQYRDRQSVVIANDGSLFPGDVVAARGAYQMHLALKNKSGGAIDPHAGHNH